MAVSAFKRGDIVRQNGNRWLYTIIDICLILPPDARPYRAYLCHSKCQGRISISIHAVKEMDSGFTLKEKK